MADAPDSHPRPSAQAVARRALVLRPVVVGAIVALPRDMISQLQSSMARDEWHRFELRARRERDETCASLRALGLWENVTPLEREQLDATTVSMTAGQYANGVWRIEALHVLLWALQLVDELPPWDAPSDPRLVNRLPLEAIDAFVHGAQLRPAPQLDEWRELAELWHWRSRTRELADRGHDFRLDAALASVGIRDMNDIIRLNSRTAYERGGSPEPIDGDFPAFGKAYRDLDQHEWSAVRSVSIERQFALNWLCGRAPNNRWDETPTGT